MNDNYFCVSGFGISVFYFRVFLALSENPRDRGTIVAEGGGKVNSQRWSYVLTLEKIPETKVN